MVSVQQRMWTETANLSDRRDTISGMKSDAAQTSQSYDALVAEYVTYLNAQWYESGDHPYSDYTILDVREPTITEIYRQNWWNRKKGHAVPNTIPVTRQMSAAQRLLYECERKAKHLTLSDGPILAQVQQAHVRLVEYAEVINTSHIGVDHRDTTVEHRETIHLTASIAAIVKMLEQRENVLHNLDAASLRRTAAALAADLEAARRHLSMDNFERQLAQADTPADTRAVVRRSPATAWLHKTRAAR